MMFPTLRLHDGYPRTTPDLRPHVERLQRALTRAGYRLHPDGLLGDSSVQALLAFQEARGLPIDGIAGPKTWRALDPYLRPSEKKLVEQSRIHPGFEAFRGDLAWVHEREGHAGKPYWPGGASGVTLDPGCDLAHQSITTIRNLYEGVFSEEEFDVLDSVIGESGNAAKCCCNSRRDLMRLRVSKQQALKVMPALAVRYWKAVCKRFPELLESTTPPSVQTAMLSLAYNRGSGNRGLTSLERLIKAAHKSANWLPVAKEIGAMQQNHRLPGIRKRRRMEAELIENELSFGGEWQESEDDLDGDPYGAAWV